MFIIKMGNCCTSVKQSDSKNGSIITKKPPTPAV
jgi:hypothetical protein